MILGIAKMNPRSENNEFIVSEEKKPDDKKICYCKISGDAGHLPNNKFIVGPFAIRSYQAIDYSEGEISSDYLLNNYIRLQFFFSLHFHLL